MSAFLIPRDQERAVAHALQDSAATFTGAVNVEGRKTVKSRMKSPLTDMSVRVAEVITANHPECYNAKLREVTVVYKGRDRVVTPYPSDFYRP